MALSRWTLDHPESSIDHVLKNISDGIDNGMELLQFIPDSPFPARGLIGALAHLVKLGAVCGANQNILDESAQCHCYVDYIDGCKRCSSFREGYYTLGS
jgi:hypothetical protein